MNNSVKPLARREGLVVQELKGEVLVYDLTTNKAHCLNESAANIWKNCDGTQTIGEIARSFKKNAGRPVDEDFVWLAIEQLNGLDLLEQELKPDFRGRTRREVLRKIGLASVIALPIISSLVAPQAAQAGFSCNVGASCVTSADCDAGCTQGCQGGPPGVCTQ